MSRNSPVCIVTGAAGGIGLATCRRLANAGTRLLLADRDAAGLERARTALAEYGHIAQCVTDVTDADSVAQLVAHCDERFGGIDMLVNGAGTCPVHAGVADLAIDDWDRIVAVNLRGTFLCSKAVLPALRVRGGTIVNIASAAALYWPPGYPAYAAAKAGVLALTQCMAREVAPLGIAVKAIRPVYVDTVMGRDAFVDQNGRPPAQADAGAILQVDEVARIIVSMLDPATACATSTVVDTLVVRPPSLSEDP